MKKITKSLVLLCATAPLALFAATPDKAPATNPPTDSKAPKAGELFNTVIAKGNGVSVTRAQLDDAMISINAAAAARGQVIPPQQRTMIEQQVLQQKIQLQLLLNKATDADKAAAKTLFEDTLKKIKTSGKLTDEEFDQKLSQQLKVTGQTREQWNNDQMNRAIAETVLKRELKPTVSDEEVKKYYDEHPARFEQPEMVRAAHILLMTQDPATGEPLSEDKKAEKKKQMEDILKRAKAGEDFGKLAEQYSEDPGSKDKGGEYTFPRGQMVKEFEDTAFSLNTNQISDIVTTQYGYHIIKLYEKIPAKKVSFDEVKNDLKEGLMQQELQKQIPAYMNKLEQDAKVEILDESLKPPKGAMEEEGAGETPAAASPKPGANPAK